MTFAKIAMLLNCASFRWRVIVMRRLHKKKEERKMKQLRDGKRNGKVMATVEKSSEKKSVERHQKRESTLAREISEPQLPYTVARFTIYRSGE